MSDHHQCKNKPVVRLAAIVFVTLLSVRDAPAGDVDTSGWACQLCAPSGGWELDIQAGPGYVTDDEFKFGDYTGLDDDGWYLFGDFFARYRDENGHQVRLEGYRLGQDSRAIFAKGGKQGLFKARTSYQGIPRRIYDDTRTPYGGSGSDRLTLPSNWVRAPSTQGMTELDSSLNNVKIEQDWDIYNAGIAFTPTKRWTFDTNYRRQERDQQDSYAGSFFFNAAEFARPIDYETDELEASVAYHADRWQVGLGYFGSFFNNSNSGLTWDNPYSSQLPGDTTGELALPPDNKAHQFTLTGSLTLPVNTAVNGQLSLGRMNQDEDLLPYTTNSLVPTSPLPRKDAGGEVDTTSANLRITSSPIRKFTLEGEFRYNERDNDTPEEVYDYVVTDLFTSPDPARNTAYDFQQYDYKIRGEYRVLPRTRFHAGSDFQRLERTRQERDHTSTDRIWGQVKSRLFDLAEVDLELYTEDRDGSSYKTQSMPDPQNPLMRVYNMANRERNGIKTYISLHSGDRANLGIDMEHNRDQYDDSRIGLVRNAHNKHYGINASYLFNRNISGYASLYQEQIKSEQANSQSFSDPDWSAETRDKNHTFTLGLRYPRIIGKLGTDVEYNYARSRGETFNDTGGLESDFPDLRSKLHQLKLGFDYPYNDALRFKFGYMYEKFDTDDWHLEGIGPDTVPNLLSLGADTYDYTNHVFFIGMRYVFDSRGQAGPRLSPY